MKSLLIIVLAITAFLMLPAFAYAQTYQAGEAAPPIAQPLVREGTLAVTLAGSLQLGQTTSEVDAESLLSAAGIAPRNGWVADYPVTPDIASELRSAVSDAATAGSLNMDEDAALAAYDGVMTQYNLSVKADTSGESGQSAPSYPDTAAADDYYSDYGPPVVTYYAPPVDYAYLYTWVPYPFWGWNSWFPGFFVLADFDIPVYVHGHACFVSNHFFDRDDRRFVRINAFDRFHARAYRHRRSVVGPSAVSAGGRRTIGRFWSGRGGGGAAITGNGVITRGGRRMRSPSGSRGSVSRNRTFRTAPNRGSWNGRSNRTFAPSPKSYSVPAPGRAGRFFRGTRPFEGFRGGSFGREKAMRRSEGFRSETRRSAGSFSSFSAPAPRRFNRSFGGGRAFGGFRGGSFGGGWRR